MLIKKNQKGVTIFELMVTIILSGIMMTGAVLIYMQFMELWDSDASRLEVQRQGTYALGVMEKAIKRILEQLDRATFARKFVSTVTTMNKPYAI